MSAAQQVRWIPLEDIVEEAPDAALGEVVLVRPTAQGQYRLLAGGDRLRRMKEAGQACVDAVLGGGKMEEKLNELLEAMVRGSIHYLDEAQAYADLLSSGLWDMAGLAQRLGRTPATVRRKLRLLELTDETRQMLRENGLCEGYAQQLLRIPGVGRKTANLLLGDLYSVPGSVVCDTHCIRISGRLGLTDGTKDPEKCEQQLRKILPPEESSDFCHRIVLFGRDICTARSPKCGQCPLSPWCKEVGGK